MSRGAYVKPAAHGSGPKKEKYYDQSDLCSI